MSDNRTGASLYGPGEAMPTKTGGKRVMETHTMTYWKLDEDTGEIIECKNLPADRIFFQRYLSRGLVTDRNSLEAKSAEIKARLRGDQPVETVPLTISNDKLEEVSQEEESDKVEPSTTLVCEVCGFVARSQFGLMSHMKKHK
jgi:hypothetical protein